jgi:hypothetical protein
MAWREEQALLEHEGVVAGGDVTLHTIRQHHDTVLQGFAASGSVDLTRDEERLSAGMRLATLLGAAALSIAWAMLVGSLWNQLVPGAKLALVWLPPLALLVATGVAARRLRDPRQSRAQHPDADLPSRSGPAVAIGRLTWPCRSGRLAVSRPSSSC